MLCIEFFILVNYQILQIILVYFGLFVGNMEPQVNSSHYGTDIW